MLNITKPSMETTGGLGDPCKFNSLALLLEHNAQLVNNKLIVLSIFLYLPIIPKVYNGRLIKRATYIL